MSSTADFLIKCAVKFAVAGRPSEAWRLARKLLDSAPKEVQASLALGDIFERERIKAFATMEEYAEIMRKIGRDVGDGEDWKDGG